MWVRALVVFALLMLASEALALADQPLKPVTFTVVDHVTKKPVTEFSYALRVIVPGEVGREQEQEKIKPIEVKSASGTFVVQVPVSCKLSLDLEAPDVVAGCQHASGSLFTVLSSDPERTFVAELELGHQVKGIVRDSETRRPIPGVKVAAAPFTEWHQWRGPFLEHLTAMRSFRSRSCATEPTVSSRMTIVAVGAAARRSKSEMGSRRLRR